MEDDDEDDESQDLGGRSFDQLEDEVERLAATANESASEGTLRSRGDEEDWFAEQVRQAIDDLPDEFVRTLDDVAIVVSDEGHENKAYGLYRGRTVGHEPMIGRPIDRANLAVIAALVNALRAWFPKLTGYRVELPDDDIRLDLEDAPPFEIADFDPRSGRRWNGATSRARLERSTCCAQPTMGRSLSWPRRAPAVARFRCRCGRSTPSTRRPRVWIRHWSSPERAVEP
jgi:hypothetical protein